MSEASVIHPDSLYAALVSGASRIEANQDVLNQANGFPVPDRDTGSNLAYLFGAIRRQMGQGTSVAVLLGSLSDIALRWARGNSGAIFSQYFNGLYQAARQMNEALPLHALAVLFQTGYEYAIKAVQSPKEGTILTAMRSFSEAFADALAKKQETEALTASLSTLRVAVDGTKNTLPQQKALQMPDAGAMAFLYFVEGFVDSIISGAPVPAQDSAIIDITQEISQIHSDEVLTHRYCTEVLLEKAGTAPLQTKVHKVLFRLGDSQVVSETDSLLRAHVHSNHPDQVVDALSAFGRMVEVKADDMTCQQALSRDYPGQTALVIDSIADVPDSLLSEHVYRLPLNLLMDGVSYQDKRTMSASRVKENRARISSSQLNRSEVSAFLDPILCRYDRVLILCVSSRMSGLYDRFMEYKRAHPDRDITLVDSRLNSGAQGLLTLYASKMQKEGMAPQDIAARLEALRLRTKIYVSVPDLSAMVSSGRLNRRIGKLLMALRFLPLITINQKGEGSITGLTSSQKANQQLLLNKLKKALVAEYALVYAGDPARARQAATAIRDALGQEPAYISDISSVVSLFAGEGAYAVAYIEKEPS